jgi:hypothetical protein
MDNLPLSLLASRIRETVRLDPVNWASSCGVTLRPYQREIALAVKDSVLNRRGLTFVVVLPRQSGKNEVQSHIFAWLLFRTASVGGRIVSVSPTFKPQTINNMDRVGHSLESCIGSRRAWRRSNGCIFRLGKSRLQFFSGEPTARVVGATADLLLSVDEAQEVDPAKFDKDFDPMTASTNATRIFWGTAWTTDTLLERQYRLAMQAQQQDGIRRVFRYTAEDIFPLLPEYRAHVERVICEKGRNHPLVRTQYFGETIDAQSGMFTPARLALIFSPFSALAPSSLPESAARAGGGGPPHAIAFLIDVAGVDESRLGIASVLHHGDLNNPGRDSTTLTVVEIDLSTLATLQRPSYRVVQRLAWTGENHVAVFGKLRNLAEQARPLYMVVDATGVGEGLWSMLDHAFPSRVIPVKFTAQEKSEIGWRFLSIIETGRFQDCSDAPRSNLPGMGQAVAPDEIRTQYSRCICEILPGPNKTLRWGVPEGTRDDEGSLVHDDFILADSLTAVLDRLEWHLPTISSPPVFVEGTDPFKELGMRFDRF